MRFVAVVVALAAKLARIACRITNLVGRESRHVCGDDATCLKSVGLESLPVKMASNAGPFRLIARTAAAWRRAANWRSRCLTRLHQR